MVVWKLPTSTFFPFLAWSILHMSDSPQLVVPLRNGLQNHRKCITQKETIWPFGSLPIIEDPYSNFHNWVSNSAIYGSSGTHPWTLITSTTMNFRYMPPLWEKQSPHSHLILLLIMQLIFLLLWWKICSTFALFLFKGTNRCASNIFF